MSSKNKVIKDSEQRAQDLLFSEAVENMHNEQIMRLWNKYKYLFWTAIIAVVLAVACLEVYKNHQMKMLIYASDQYEQAAVLNAKGQVDEAFESYAALQYSKTNYKYLSMLRRAGIMFENDQPDQALPLLQAVYSDDVAPEVLRVSALFGWVTHQIDTADVQELHRMIAPYLVATSPWYGTAVELEVMLQLRQNKTADALSYIDQALSVTSLPASTKERLETMKQALTGK